MSQPLFTEQQIADLHQAYRDAVYEVYHNRKTILLFIDRLNPKLDSILEKYHGNTWALITAHNPYSQCLPPVENEQRQLKLVEIVRANNLIFLDGVGKDQNNLWTPEPSIFIVNIELEQAIAIGQEFQQNAIVWGEFGKKSKLLWL